ncbi:uracil-DNA glycosylase family protein [Salipiger sp. H15]|uniref:Uracil-DNA glycosylase n=1 Tax=Alloyangia sp. H15 TaxID=3029062 RepID=A0AAU8AGQ7_9RHOB
MVSLRERIERHLAGNWREDLAPAWRRFFENVEPVMDDLPDWDAPEVFPPRLALGRPREDADEVPCRHMTRAFDDLIPERVRVVIIGQDPYPSQPRATGRAFEDGAWNEAQPAKIAVSLRRLLQSAASASRGDLGITEDRSDWPSVRAAIAAGELAPPAMPGFFDALASRDVLSVNAAWTFTSSQQRVLDTHIRIWRPVMEQLLLKLLRREGDPPLVFLLLGRKAQDRFREATWQHFQNHPARNVELVYCAHPKAWTGRTYFEHDNPFVRINEALDRLESPPIEWWPRNLAGQRALAVH